MKIEIVKKAVRLGRATPARVTRIIEVTTTIEDAINAYREKHGGLWVLVRFAK